MENQTVRQQYRQPSEMTERVKAAILDTVKQSYDRSLHDVRAISQDLEDWMQAEPDVGLFIDALGHWDVVYAEILSIEQEWIRLIPEEDAPAMIDMFKSARQPLVLVRENADRYTATRRPPQMNVNNSNMASGDAQVSEVEKLREEINRLREEIRASRESTPRSYLPPVTPSRTSARSMVSSESEMVVTRLVSALDEVTKRDRLPKIEPDVFRGDPLKFPRWWKTFQLMIESDASTDTDRLLFLSQYTAGDAKDIIEPYLSSIGDPEAYSTAKKELFTTFGDRVKIADSYRKKIREWPTLKKGDAVGLRKYASFLQQCKSAMASVGYLGTLNHAEENARLAAKLPQHLMERWNRHVVLKLEQVNSSLDCESWESTQLDNYPKFDEFCSFVTREARVADGPCVMKAERTESTTPRYGPSTGPRRNAHTFQTEAEEEGSQPPQRYKPNCLFCKEEHYINNCDLFIAQTPIKKRMFARQNRLCFGCLRRGHSYQYCNNRLDKLNMFSDRAESTNVDQVPRGTTDASVAPNEPKEALSMRTGVEGAVARFNSMIVPVVLSCVRGNGSSVCTYAMLDTQSDSCFVRDDVAEAIGADLEEIQLKLTTMGTKCQIPSAIVKDVLIRGIKEDQTLKINKAYTRPEIPAGHAGIPRPSEVRSWKGLEAVAKKLHPYQEDWKIGVLVGYSCWKAFKPEEVITTPNGPFGVKTPLGWSVIGPNKKMNDEEDEVMCHRTETEEMSMENLKKIFDGDFEVKSGEEKKMSAEDEYFLELMKEKIKTLEGGRIQLPLPIRPDIREIPDSKNMALKRFYTLQRKFTRDAGFKEKYVTFIEDMLSRGHAEPVPTEDLLSVGKKWYLPHQGVVHPRKPGKVRVVFDGSASVQGVCLNSLLIPGPDMCNALLGVLCRFRLEVVAFTCDIEGMFLQVKVDPDDRDYLRFFWADKGNEGPIKEYRVCVHLFGATSSPACATYALREVAARNESKYGSDAAEFVRKNFYVDDGLRSEKTSAEATSLIQRSHDMCAEGMFNLCKYVSNDEEVNSKIPEELKPKVKATQKTMKLEETQMPDLVAEDEGEPYVNSRRCDVGETDDDGMPSLEPGEVEYDNVVEEDIPELIADDEVLEEVRRVEPVYSDPGQIGKKQPEAIRKIESQQTGEVTLGMGWFRDSDDFGYHFKKTDKPPTRRGMLSQLGSVYDPLGLVSPLLLKGRNILQSICKSGLSWDDEVPEEVQEAWKNWYEDLGLLSDIRIRRCFRKSIFGDATVEYHICCDASDAGYGACAYVVLRHEDKLDSSLALAKSRVHPTKAVTTPRMELQAAVLAIRMKLTLLEELPYQVSRVVLYSDSTIVLAYIQNDKKRVSVYVRNQVREIRDNSEVQDWKHIATDRNPADLASRGVSVEELKENKLWFEGPTELMSEDLPTVTAEIGDSDPELRKEKSAEVFLSYLDEDTLGLEDRLAGVESWHKMKSYIAWWKRYCVNKRRTLKKEEKINFDFPPTVDELNEAGKLIIKSTQMAWFSPEYVILRKNRKMSETGHTDRELKCVKKDSRLYRLDPELSEEGLITVGGRIRRADLPDELRHPLILPAEGHITAAIIKHHHEEAAHIGRNHTLSELRTAGWWVVRGRKTIDKVLRKCFICRRWRATPRVPKMSDLPKERLEVSAPFSHIGVDLFGPLYVKEGRKSLKRWGCLFTCLSTRAVHIEPCRDLTTSSFMNAIRRMIARRGKIRTLRSDRGTNLMGMRNELAREMRQIDHSSVRAKLAEKGCDYIHFETNPPHSPHMGGIWERLIGSTKRILVALMTGHKDLLNDEGLHMLLLEAESIVNSRPLTYVPVTDADDLAPLTPLKLLTMKDTPTETAPGDFTREDLFSRKTWRRVQHLTEEFWKRWKKEYLPTIQARNKWIEDQGGLKEDDIVLVSEPNLPRAKWPLGRVVELRRSQDHRVRSVTVRMGHKLYERPVKDIVLLHREGVSGADTSG